MKKLFAIAAITASAMSAHADITTLYIAGPAETTINGKALGNWDIVNTLEVTLNRGKFTLDCKNLSQIGISDKKLSSESWGDWGTGLWSMTAAFTENDLGKPMPLAGPGAGNFIAPWKGDWKLEISSDLKTVTLTTTTPKPETTYHLVGDNPIGWGASDKWKFEKETDTVYWLDVTDDKKITGPTGNINIIQNSSWEVWWGANSKPITASESASEWIWQANGTGKSFEDGQSYTGTIRLEVPSEIASGCKAKVTFFPTIVDHISGGSGVSGITADEDATEEYYNLQGIRIAEPQKGIIYIVRKGSKVSKAIF